MTEPPDIPDADLPPVTVMVPCRNEEGFIADTLESIVTGGYPEDRMQVLVIDGMSDDRTADTVREYAERHPCVELLENPRRIVPTALNIAVERATGEVVLRMDAHTTYSDDYIRQCVKHLLARPEVDNVGPRCVTVPSSDTPMGRAIAVGLAHPFAVGNSYFRVGASEPRTVDALAFGCYRREVFDRIGRFDEDMVRNQDDEFNSRLIRNGGKILLVPGIVAYYRARDKLGKLWRMYWQYGYFKPLGCLKIGAVPTIRQLVPAGLVGGLGLSAALGFAHRAFWWLGLAVAALYLVAGLVFSVRSAIAERRPGLVLLLPLVFATFHFGYGLGYLKGILDFVILRRHRRRAPTDAPLSR
jgi:cellulose synthase/poly-beta-1,6-N-acetylglucosamine synthase-like glycosyltransferase